MMMLDANPSLRGEGDVHFPNVDEEDREETKYAILDYSDSESSADDQRLPSFSVVPGPRMDALVEVVLLVEDIMRNPVVAVSPDQAAELATMCAHTSQIQAVTIQIAFGREVGVENRRKWLSLIAEAEVAGMTVDEYARQPGPLNELAFDRIERLFRGVERQGLLRDRVVHGIAILRRVIALLPNEYRTGPLCSLAWLQCAHGKRAIAMAYLAEVVRLQPGNAMAIVLSIFFDARTPVWLHVQPNGDRSAGGARSGYGR